MRNASDFLTRSVEELLEGDFKFSAVHFYQAVELFVKARLLLEHWSLVMVDPAKADRAKFERGDFLSVTLPQAVQRLDTIVGEEIGGAAKAFDPVRKRRNRVIHFHAIEYPARTSRGHVVERKAGPDLFSSVPPAVTELVAEQCLAWYELHLLLTVRWKLHFREFSSEIERLNRRMLDVRPYLQTRFKRLAPDIEKARSSGAVITDCSACGLAASEDVETFPGMTQSQCLVCLRHEQTFCFDCPEDDCIGAMTVKEGAGGECSKCGHAMSIAELVSHFETPYDPSSGGESSTAYCAHCESHEGRGGTVQWVADADRYVCFSCLEDFDEVASCEWCNERITGDAEDTYWLGCMNCDGHAGHVADRDD